MPHATHTEDMEDVNEDTAISGFLQELDGDGYGLGSEFSHDREIDQTDKAEDAVDYEDISDDDLILEEGTTDHANGDNDNDDDFFNGLPHALGGLPVAPSQQHTNGYHADDATMAEQLNGQLNDYLDEEDDTQDLFGERTSSPEQQREAPSNHAHPPPPRPGGLALPSKSALALPGMATNYQHPHLRQVRQTSESMSPSSSFHGGEYSPVASDEDGDEEEEEEGEDGITDMARAQRLLFQQASKRQRGERVADDRQEVDLDWFYSTYPSFETNQVPNFLDLFPARPFAYRGKVPPKPPRALHPTKTSLDLLPDQEKLFRASGLANKSGGDDARKEGLVYLNQGSQEDESDDDGAWSTIDDDERIGNVTMQDLAVICGDWDVCSIGTAATSENPADIRMVDDWEDQEQSRPRKRQKIDVLDQDLDFAVQDHRLTFEEPERATARLAKSIILDLNDPNLLIDELGPKIRRKTARTVDRKRGGRVSRRDALKRYNISNDEQYEALKENHHHKVRSTLGSVAVEHSLVAAKLQYPFYKIQLDSKQKRAFHRPHLDVRDGRGREFKFHKPKYIKRKHIKGREAKDVFAASEDLTLGDNSSVMLLEYSEEAPMMLSNFGMGSRLINYYRKRDADDQERPKREIGETNVLLTQDKSPFANFGYVDRGEVVPAIQNGMYRAPIFQHEGESTDFLVGLSSSYQNGHRFTLRNIENLHVVGQQFPLSEVPTQHSRKVTDAAKKRLRALSYRIYNKSVDPMRRGAKPLNNENLMPHLPGHDMPQTRSKMREFMKYERAPAKEAAGTWVPMPGQIVPDNETVRAWIKPEDVCLLDSMQAGVQHLADLGMVDSKDGDVEKDDNDEAHIEILLAPWRTTKNFLQAGQGKAMLKLHGEGDPTGRGDGFSFVKTSMKGGFQALGASIDDMIEAKKRRETGGHSYNVAKQQKLYDDSIRSIWDKQKQSLSADAEVSDTEMEDDIEDTREVYPYGRGGTPRSSIGTPAAFARYDDESASQFSRGSVAPEEKTLTITRKTTDLYGKDTYTYETVTNPRVIEQYRKKTMLKQVNALSHEQMRPTDDAALNAIKKKELEDELRRVERNRERREQREKVKGRASNADAPSAASPGQSSADGTTPQKTGRGKKDGTARKCANCGQVGHIKTNRKLCPLLNGTMTPADAALTGNSAFGAAPAPLAL